MTEQRSWWRPGLRSKLLALSSLLLALPWFGYQYIREMETYLQRGQEQAVASMAQALALTLNERPLLFNTATGDSQSRLYVYPLPFKPDVHDGTLDDWRDFRQHEQAFLEGSSSPYPGNAKTIYRDGGQGDPLQMNLLVGEHGDDLFLYLRVLDRHVVAPKGGLQLQGSDGVTLALAGNDGSVNHYRLAVQSDGTVQAWRQTGAALEREAYVPEPRIEGRITLSDSGYDCELQLPVALASRTLVVAVEDVDDSDSDKPAAIVASGDANAAGGTLQRPASVLESLLAAQPLANFRVRVYDSEAQLLFEHGDITHATGLQIPPRSTDGNLWRMFRTRFLHPLYDGVLVWLDARNNPPLPADVGQSPQLTVALQGGAQSGYRTETGGMRTLEAAWPIAADGQVAGAVLVDQNLAGLHSARNQSLSSLFDAMLAILLLTIAALLVFAGSLSRRIRNLRDQAEHSIDDKGRLHKPPQPLRSRDEIGDLSRAIAGMVERIGHYNQYLENLTARLSHELRTPVTVVRSSLENLRLLNHADHETDTYLQRAEEGISRLNLILTNMSEATRLEQILQGTDTQPLRLEQLVAACVEQYRQVYPAARFVAEITGEPVWVQGSAEHLVQLLDKVVANAVEFSAAGRPVRLACNEDSGEAVLTVSNSGPSLDPGMKDRIFDSMVSVRPQGTKGLPHLGLGLRIAKLIADFHHGEIYADNLIGEPGVIVVVRLPILHHD
ncbi:MAG TPA: ATP-binding protein [Candidatus Acidoferrum sp.]|nr:ATP-binding protein [Candidatus Acidoferrum sp.]